jgi:hypothetical protein
MTITLKPRAVEVLRRISHQPRTLHGLTHAENGVADIQCSANVIKAYLDHLAEEGLITAPARPNGYYTVTEDGLAYLAGLPQVACSTLICAASMKQPYVPSVGYQRNDGHRGIRSRGMGV